jgi:hypothetical protein
MNSLWDNYEAMADAALTPENRFRAAAMAGRNCFLTGMGGTGKTTELKKFIEACPRRVDVTAPTGVAALNAGGMTLHRFCGMLLGPATGTVKRRLFGATAPRPASVHPRRVQPRAPLRDAGGGRNQHVAGAATGVR